MGSEDRDKGRERGGLRGGEGRIRKRIGEMLGPGLIEAGGSAELPVGSVQVSTFPRLKIDPTEPEA